METKRCTKCGEEKAMDAFPRSKRMTSGRDSWCRACRSASNRSRRQQHPEAVRAVEREHRRKNPELEIFRDIVRRCTDSRRTDFHHYGGRGIRVADEWLAPGGFALFFEHIGPRPSPRHSVDRIETSGNYEPGNVRWATQREQMRHMSRTRLITALGRTQCLAAWADELGVHPRLIHQRLDLLGWTPDDAVSLPAGMKRAA